MQDLNNEIDNYFQSPPERQSSNLFLRKLEDISNEMDSEKGEVIFTLCSIITIQIIANCENLYQADHELKDDADSDLDTADNKVNYIWHTLLAVNVYYSHHIYS